MNKTKNILSLLNLAIHQKKQKDNNDMTKKF